MWQDDKPPLQRIAVIGTTGSGKSTLSATLADALNLTLIEPDGLVWDDDWHLVERPVFRERLQVAFQKAEQATSGWVFAGNYYSSRHLIWTRTDTIIWLDYSLPRILWQIVTRSIRHIRAGEKLWGTNNQESIRRSFFSRHSMLVRALKVYWRDKRRYDALFADVPPEYAPMHCIRLRSPRETDQWVTQLLHSDT